ncbi:MAG: SpoIID/LytB domain-containing protein [Cyanobacteria bacterium REEB67]|nr:SpoIID/LytB domain-containing protein [Cyanobacteria bacterium REEB67]
MPLHSIIDKVNESEDRVERLKRLREDTSLLRLAKVYKRQLFGAYVALVTLALAAGPQLASNGRTNVYTNAAADAKGTTSKSTAVAGGGPTIIAFTPYPPMIYPTRIGLQTRVSNIRLVVWTPGAVFIDNRPVFALKPQMVYSLSPGKITELATGQSFPLPFDRRATVAAPDYRIWANNRWWRGSLEAISLSNGITAVNVLDLEDYLKGVVPSEMPSSWQPEALKCQAVAARSYAVAHLGAGSKWKSEGFDLVPDVRDQAYKGLAAEAASTNLAVWLTRGVILQNANRVKAGFYRAWVGDDMENLNIRKTNVPKSQLEKITGVKDIVGVTVMQNDAQQNARAIQVIGAKNSRPVDGVILAKWLGLATAGILDIREDGNTWCFTYRGPGNGARGMSQHGANTLAQHGWKFDQILKQYYQDNDGMLRLGIVPGYMQFVPAMAGRKMPKKEQLTFSKGSIVETEGDASAKSKAEAEKGEKPEATSGSGKASNNNNSNNSSTNN